MDENLDLEFNLWLGRFAVDWAVKFDSIPEYLGRVEVKNRQDYYPGLAKALSSRPLDRNEIKSAINKCWAVNQQHDAIRLGDYLNAENTLTAIVSLLNDFPTKDVDASERIDNFLTECRQLEHGASEIGKLDQSLAALITSVLLTAVLPKRFVDFRRIRWKRLAEELEYPLFTSEKPTYGQMLIETGKFAKAITETETFKKWWPNGEPLWSIAGVAWAGNSDRGMKRPDGLKEEDVIYEEEFDEGRQRLRQHFIRERSTAVVKAAKESWRKADPLLHCDVCGFSFTVFFGDIGLNYIEAHHMTPISKLQAGEKTKVGDLAKVCANCHRMLHVGSESLSIEQLRGRLNAS